MLSDKRHRREFDIIPDTEFSLFEKRKKNVRRNT